jgi:hypothetical protein
MSKRKGIKFNPSHGVSIEDSLITSNHLIVYNGKVFDSALEYDDAVKVALWLRRQIKIGNPPPDIENHDALLRWLSRVDIMCPEVDAETITIRSNGMSFSTYKKSLF